MTTLTVACIGLGRMGSGIAGNIQERAGARAEPTGLVRPDGNFPVRYEAKVDFGVWKSVAKRSADMPERLQAKTLFLYHPLLKSEKRRNSAAHFPCVRLRLCP